VGDAFVCKVCEGGGDAENISIQESMDLGNGIHLGGVGNFCYLGDMLNGGREVNSLLVVRVHCVWKCLESCLGS